ncbi:hypothetical protein AB9F29_13870 [Falsihalocynthiibacter sp. S25ZX9]
MASQNSPVFDHDLDGWDLSDIDLSGGCSAGNVDLHGIKLTDAQRFKGAVIFKRPADERLGQLGRSVH